VTGATGQGRQSRQGHMAGLRTTCCTVKQGRHATGNWQCLVSSITARVKQGRQKLRTGGPSRICISRRWRLILVHIYATVHEDIYLDCLG
jgi:hypothetical protein